MSATPLPTEIDIRKLVVKGAEISADVPIASLPRIQDLLASNEGNLAVELQFFIDDERHRCVSGKIAGVVQVFCQRCLNAMDLPIDTQFELAVVWSEQDSERLPKSLEPLIVGEELSDLGEVVAEELILALPYVSYHDPEDCEQPSGYSSVDSKVAEQLAAAEKESEKANPFQVLQEIKFDKR